MGGLRPRRPNIPVLRVLKPLFGRAGLPKFMLLALP